MATVEKTVEKEGRGFRGLPPLAGVCSFTAARRPGLSVERCVGRLKRFHYAFKRLHEILTVRITAEPIYELKTAFSHHSYLCAENVAALRKRVGEMREPPLGLEDVPHPALELLFNEILAAPDAPALVLGVYAVAMQELRAACQSYLDETNPLADYPSARLLKFSLADLNDMLDFGQAAIDALVDDSSANALESWRNLLANCLSSANGLDGEHPPQTANASDSPPIPAPHFSQTPYRYNPTPRRDDRFGDSYNAGVNPEAFLYDEQFSPRDKTLMMSYKRLREIDVPEMMASILAETKGKPWGYYLEMSRQLWDEARHAMFGEVGFVANGIDWTQIPINFTWSLNLNTQLTPIERHAVLYFIEQGLMPRNGKRYEWEVAASSGDPLSALFQDFDWADEVLHARIGRDWYVKDFANLKESLDYGDRCWTKVVSHWHSYRDKGLTDHRNWWPEIYAQACRNWGVSPDPQALSFAVTYESQRADLKAISASG